MNPVGIVIHRILEQIRECLRNNGVRKILFLLSYDGYITIIHYTMGLMKNELQWYKIRKNKGVYTMVRYGNVDISATTPC